MWTISQDIENICGIYCITNTINNKTYIGSSKNIYQRLNKHRAYLRKNIHDNKKLQSDWNIFGEDNFKYEIIELCEKDNLLVREQYYVNTTNSDYNLVKDVITGKLEPSSRKFQSETRKRKFKNKELIPSRQKKVYQYNLNGDFIAEYVSIHESSRITGIHITSIHRVLNGKYCQAKGFQWRYEYSDKIEKVTARNSKRWRSVKLYDLFENKSYDFNSVNECARFLNYNNKYVSAAVTEKFIMRKRYKIEYNTAVCSSN